MTQFKCMALAMLPVALSMTTAFGEPPAKPPAEPAKVDVALDPPSVTAGEAAMLRVQLNPMAGIKINRYPKITLRVPVHEGLIEPAEGKYGNDAPPPPGQTGKNYFKTLEPFELKLSTDRSAPSGRHRIEGELSYFYCVTASGFCSRATAPISVRLDVN